VNDGSLSVGSNISFSSNPKKFFTVKELNILNPIQVPIAGDPGTLHTGQVGVIVASIHDLADVATGDTIRIFKNDQESAKLFAEDKGSKTKQVKSVPMVYASIYPCEKAEFINLNKSLNKLLLNDSSVSLTKESHPALGNGFK